MAEEKGVVKYMAKDGQEISLSFQTVRDYLVQGDRALVTPQELMFFMGMCKSRGLNPFKKDCYLIKYGKDPAAIVVSIDYFRARARAQKDCKGWKAGIVFVKDGKLEKREGSIILEGEKLVGGWFEARPEGWTEPRFHSVNLKGYIKKTKEGNITRFWSEDNQPSQIMKVAESQGLRIVWPDEFQQLYSEEEISADRQDTGDGMAAAAEKARQEAIERFNKSIPVDPRGAKEALQEFLSKLAQANRCTSEDVMVEAADKPEEFWQAFQEWMKENKTPEDGPYGQQIPPIKETPPSKQNGQAPSLFQDHAAADAELAKQDSEAEKKNGKKAYGPKKEMQTCPPKGKFPGKQIAAIYCEKQCDKAPDCKAGFLDRDPGEDG